MSVLDMIKSGVSAIGTLSLLNQVRIFEDLYSEKQIDDVILSELRETKEGQEFVNRYINDFGFSEFIDLLIYSREIEHRFFPYLHSKNPDLTQVVAENCVIFDDITILDDLALQFLFKKIKEEDLFIAMMVSYGKTKNRVFSQFSEFELKDKLYQTSKIDTSLESILDAQYRVAKEIKTLLEDNTFKLAYLDPDFPKRPSIVLNKQ